MEQSTDDKEELSGAERIARSQNVTFTSGLSKDELDKPKLQRIPTPYYEHLGQAVPVPEDNNTTTTTTTSTAGNDAVGKGVGQQALQPGSGGGGGGAEEEKDEVKDLKQSEMTTKIPPKFASGRRIHREFSMSRDDDDE